ncbi:flagellar hook-associated protein FlgK [Breoghania sp.]|uniref:flagellar hook-associated protein FlgK n=1 Tax=Breoghania sp. TaxID=2065378 RepID=UPI0029CA4886|nr:flagellar hook-associated protein FlgK [Breoghania sp.]
MSLSVALRVAQSSLAARQKETAIASQNIAGASTSAYSRKSVLLSSVVNSSGQSGGVRVAGIGRATSDPLYKTLVQATSVASSQDALLSGIARMADTIGDPKLESSPAAYLGQLQIAMQNYASDPNSPIEAQAALDAAKDVANALNAASRVVQDVRASADADIKASVENMNGLLEQLETLNTLIVKGNQSGADITDALDSRDQVLLALSEEVGITTLSRDDGDIVVYTDSGVTLFETTARDVSFEETPTYDASTQGNAIFVDGVPITGDDAIMPIKSGNLHGLTILRDEAAVTYQAQLDEIARGLIETFAEHDQSAGGLPLQTGLFAYSGGPGLPPSGIMAPGLAADIRIESAVDPDQGGTIDLMRDGGINGAAYVYNSAGEASFGARIQEYLDELDTSRIFDTDAGLDADTTLMGFATNSVGWLESARKSASADLEVQTVVVQRTAESLSNVTGVNIDEEMTLLLEIERGYSAAAKLISTVDKMLDDLLAAVR